MTEAFLLENLSWLIVQSEVKAEYRIWKKNSWFAETL